MKSQDHHAGPVQISPARSLDNRDKQDETREGGNSIKLNLDHI
jgi:hypothetical protein